MLVTDGLPGLAYFKLVSRDGLPVGAVALGGADGAVILGRLRPYVRWGKPLPELSSFLKGRDPAFLPGARCPGRSRGLAEQRKEAERCASSPPTWTPASPAATASTRARSSTAATSTAPRRSSA